MTIERQTVERVIIAGLIVLFASVGGYAFNAIDKRMSITEVQVALLNSVVNARGERLATLEAIAKTDEIRFKAIDDKLDLLIKIHLREGLK